MLLINSMTEVIDVRKLDGKVVLVTGGNSGIGLASVKRFIDEGAEEVFITARRQDLLDEAVRELGSRVTAIQADISKLEELDSVFAKIKQKKGRIDVLFANAGVGDTQPLGHITEESFDRIININMKGTLFTVQKALPLMKSGASIILTGSSTSQMGSAAFGVYSATKAAIRNFARCWTLDLRGTGIRVNVLSPGATTTPGLMNGLSRSGKQAEAINFLINQTPAGRMAEPDEIAAAAVFLASDESSFMSGSEMFVDGGIAQV